MGIVHGISTLKLPYSNKHEDKRQNDMEDRAEIGKCLDLWWHCQRPAPTLNSLTPDVTFEIWKKILVYFGYYWVFESPIVKGILKDKDTEKKHYILEENQGRIVSQNTGEHQQGKKSKLRRAKRNRTPKIMSQIMLLTQSESHSCPKLSENFGHKGQITEFSSTKTEVRTWKPWEIETFSKKIVWRNGKG